MSTTASTRRCNPTAGTAAGVPGTATGAGEGPLRDGTNNNTPDVRRAFRHGPDTPAQTLSPSWQPNNPDADTGLHEGASFYSDCEDRERNKGLYTADQNLNNNQGATATRQNPNGNRSGQV